MLGLHIFYTPIYLLTILLITIKVRKYQDKNKEKRGLIIRASVYAIVYFSLNYFLYLIAIEEESIEKGYAEGFSFILYPIIFLGLSLIFRKFLYTKARKIVFIVIMLTLTYLPFGAYLGYEVIKEQRILNQEFNIEKFHIKFNLNPGTPPMHLTNIQFIEGHVFLKFSYDPNRESLDNRTNERFIESLEDYLVSEVVLMQRYKKIKQLDVEAIFKDKKYIIRDIPLTSTKHMDLSDYDVAREVVKSKLEIVELKE